jgi:Imm-5 like putative immunity protein
MEKTGDAAAIELSPSELREVAAYAAAFARPAPAIFERGRPDDRRPRAAIDAARAFADGAAFLHPLANAIQVKHILESAACAARAFEPSAGDDHAAEPPGSRGHGSVPPPSWWAS